MRFSPVPSESKRSINKAGQILTILKSNNEEIRWALDLANRWRACHAYPINTFQATLRGKIKNYDGDSIVAQRLKRMPTIIDKLKRYPSMQLTTMQDIGGVRAVLSAPPDVYKLATEYKSIGRFDHELVDEKDYIANPRDEDGYRSLHLIYKYQNIRNPSYDGLRLELQLRTKLQHTWATAVETMGTFLGQALKSRKGDKEWIDFFAIVSAAFSIKERTPAIPRYSELSPKEVHLAVARANTNLGALEKMRGFSIAVDQISKTRNSRNSSFYHLIILNSLEKNVQIRAYDRENLAAAMEDYSQYEEEAAMGKMIEPVLVSAGPIDTLRRAYPNFFLDIGDFVRIVARIVASARK